MLSLICGIQTLIQMQQYYEKQVMLRRGHRQEGEGKQKEVEVIRVDELSIQE
jgi:hypothetical protein